MRHLFDFRAIPPRHRTLILACILFWSILCYLGLSRFVVQGGEVVVSVKNYPAIELGQVLIYSATYHDKPIIHRAVEKDGYGWLMSGDSSPRSESWARVTEENYLGTAVAAYRKL